MLRKYFTFSQLTLLVALSLSSVAAYYSIIGLTAIFAGAVIPVIIMGGILEVGKITATVWLRKYWNRASWILKLYLVPAVIALALLTSMGIFGFLSKAHMDSGITSGDVTAKVALLDEKIKTQRDNIDIARKALAQMDAQVDARLDRGGTEQGAERAVQIRRQQAGERTKLQKEIGEAQKVIQTLNEERAPIASELRKVEAEVGPIKYIAALIYGDDADNNMLESAVRWMIILLVIVFDPLAIALVLAANASKEWDKEEPKYEKDDGPLSEEQIDQLKESVKVVESPKVLDIDEGNRLIDEIEKEFPEVILPDTTKNKPIQFIDPGEHPNDFDETQVEDTVVEKEDKLPEQPLVRYKNLEPMVWGDGSVVEVKPEETITVASVVKPQVEIITEGVTKKTPYIVDEAGYISYDGKHMTKEVFADMYPDMFKLSVDTGRSVNTNFGIKFPEYSTKGDTFVRVDMLPNRVFKFDGKRWIEVNKQVSDTYLHDEQYIKYLIQMIDTGQYDIELLSDKERAEIETYLTKNVDN